MHKIHLGQYQHDGLARKVERDPVSTLDNRLNHSQGQQLSRFDPPILIIRPNYLQMIACKAHHIESGILGLTTYLDNLTTAFVALRSRGFLVSMPNYRFFDEWDLVIMNVPRCISLETRDVAFHLSKANGHYGILKNGLSAPLDKTMITYLHTTRS